MNYMSSQLTLDFRSVAYAKFFYVNQFGETAKHKPRVPTLHCKKIPEGYAFPLLWEYPSETNLERVRRLGLCDEFTPHCILQLRNNHSLSFVGFKANQMFSAYNAHIYGSSNKT